jgi:nucleoside 2-deoxyribosyltransferase
MSKTLYLANPYGFSKQQHRLLIPEIKSALEGLGATVLEPFERNDKVDFTAAGWPNRIAQANLEDIQGSDGIFAIVNGCPPDEGVMVEVGIGIGHGKELFLFRDDFRRCADSEDYPLNLMVFTSLGNQWKRHWFSDLDELGDPDKALVPWLSDGSVKGDWGW